MPKFWEYKKASVNLSVLAENAELLPADADELEILLDPKLLQIEQFALKIEKNISESEQLVWHINSLLPQPIENYFYAYQIYLRDAENLQGLFCVLPKTNLAFLTARQKQAVKIYSADRQFLLYENKAIFWQITPYLQRLYSRGKIWLLGAVVFCLLSAPLLLWLQNILAAQNMILNKERQNLAAQIKARRNYERSLAALQKNKALNQKLGGYFYAFSLALPEQVYFTELNYSAQELRLDGFCPADKDLKALQKALKTDASLKPELASLSKSAVINFSLRADLKKFLAKELKSAARK
jgi:Tfp pilus assembly protein PilN